MIPKSGYRFSEKIMLQQEVKRDDDSKKSHRALDIRPAASVRLRTPFARPHQSIALDDQTNVAGPAFMSVCAVRQDAKISFRPPLLLENARGLARARAALADDRRQGAFMS
jgi:hypothetical protein